MMTAVKDWPSILRFETGDTITEAEVEKRYRQVAKKAHPDAGGSNEEMTQVNLARQMALTWIAKERERVAARHRPEQPGLNVGIYAWNQHYANAAQGAAQQQWGSQAQAMGGQQYANAGQSKASWVRDFFRRAK